MSSKSLPVTPVTSPTNNEKIPSPLHLEREQAYEIDKDHEHFHRHSDLIQCTRYMHCYNLQHKNGYIVRYVYRCSPLHEGECVYTRLCCDEGCEDRYNTSKYLSEKK